MGNGLGQLLALKLLQPHRHVDGLVPIPQLLMNDQQLGQRRLFIVAVIAQLVPQRLGPVQQTGSKKVARQLLQRQLALFPGQLAGDQVLVDLDGAVHLATLAKQVAEGEVSFDGFAVHFQQLDKEIHRLV